MAFQKSSIFYIIFLLLKFCYVVNKKKLKRKVDNSLSTNHICCQLLQSEIQQLVEQLNDMFYGYCYGPDKSTNFLYRYFMA